MIRFEKKSEELSDNKNKEKRSASKTRKIFTCAEIEGRNQPKPKAITKMKGRFVYALSSSNSILKNGKFENERHSLLYITCIATLKLSVFFFFLFIACVKTLLIQLNGNIREWYRVKD